MASHALICSKILLKVDIVSFDQRRGFIVIDVLFVHYTQQKISELYIKLAAGLQSIMLRKSQSCVVVVFFYSKSLVMSSLKPVWFLLIRGPRYREASRLNSWTIFRRYKHTQYWFNLPFLTRWNSCCFVLPLPRQNANDISRNKR